MFQSILHSVRTAARTGQRAKLLCTIAYTGYDQSKKKTRKVGPYQTASILEKRATELSIVNSAQLCSGFMYRLPKFIS
jgi:hypothetical protein